MVELNFGTLIFKDEKEYYTALGSFCNNKAFTISYEPNKKTGSYSDAYRMRKLATAKNLIQPIEDAIRTGNRINCNKYVAELIAKHKFIQNGKKIYGVLENVISTVPPAFVADFIEGYTKSGESADNSIVVYETENIKSTATSLNKVKVPKLSKKPCATPVSSKKTKHDFIKEHIRNTDIGERGEKLVFEEEKKKLKDAVRIGKISTMEGLLEWVSLEDDGAGYDIRSYDVDAKQIIYIEVKTTTSGKYTPFFMSEDEIKFSKTNASEYRLYRIYNFKNNVADYYELTGDISLSTSVEIDAVNYKVSLK